MVLATLEMSRLILLEAFSLHLQFELISQPVPLTLSSMQEHRSIAEYSGHRLRVLFLSRSRNEFLNTTFSFEVVASAY